MLIFKFKKILGLLFVSLFIFAFSHAPKQAEASHLFISSLSITLSTGNAQFNGQFNNGSLGNIVTGHSPFKVKARKPAEWTYIEGLISVEPNGNFSTSINLSSQGEGNYEYYFYDEGAHAFIGPQIYGHFDSYQPVIGQPPSITLPIPGPETPPASTITVLDTKPATSVTVGSGTLNGHFESSSFPTFVWFYYGDAQNNLNAQTAQEEKSANGDFSRNITQYGVLNLLPNTTYYYKACAKNLEGERCADNDIESFTTQNYVTLASQLPSGNGEYAPVDDNGDIIGTDVYATEKKCLDANPGKKCVQIYNLLQPLPNGDGGDLNTFNTAQKNGFANYLNILIKIFIGICAVLAMIMIVMGGIEYMTSELVSHKEEGKERIIHAIFGLLLALGSYAILNTLNPQLLNVSLSGLPTAGVTDITIPGNISFDGRAVPVNFNKDSYPAAKRASDATGVNVAYILAVFAQETGGGSNVGRCHWQDPGANMYASDQTALQTITSELGLDINTVPVSCAFGNGHGGAIGYTQFRPSTWLEQRVEAQTNLGHRPNPWVVADALMIEAVYLKNLGATTDEYNAACRYYSGAACDPNRNPPNKFYGDQVMGKKLTIQKKIEELLAQGLIT